MGKKKKHTVDSIRKEKEEADASEHALWNTAFENDGGTDPISYEIGSPDGGHDENDYDET